MSEIFCLGRFWPRSSEMVRTQRQGIGQNRQTYSVHCKGRASEAGMSCCETRECGRCKTNKLFPSGRASGRKDEPNHQWVHREEVPQCLILELQPRFSSGDAAHSRAADRRTAVGCGNAIEARPVPESFSVMLIPVSPVTNSARVRFSLPIVLSSLVTLWAVLECSLMREKTCLTVYWAPPPPQWRENNRIVLFGRGFLPR
ncbi:hypothetical protein CSPX01_09220 [Colletotrichum filicis]|nr:hypothetical protein CSPX01_09220 [Colletotrichum filicis]